MLTIVGILVWLVSYSQGDTTCLSCKMAVKPQDCETIIRCGPGEQCAAASQIGRRSTNDGMVVCTECCTTELCNSGGCGATRYPDRTHRGPLCFQCQEQNTPYGCSHITECGRNQVCRYSRTYNQVTYEPLYTTKCAERTECASVIPAFAQLMCDHCCDKDLCNHDCVKTPTTQPPVTTSLPVTTAITLSVTSSRPAVTSDACTPSPCVIGTCSHYLNTYRCTCPHGVHGRNCDIYSDPCMSSPCTHGQCLSNTNAFTCSCQPGYTGTLCDKSIDHCLANPCNYGTCSNSVQGFSCTCDQGYTGTTCNRAIDHCLANPCNYGTCSNSVQGFSCTCDQGYTGITCNTVTGDHCLSSPCVRGTCINSVHGFSCSCEYGYTGTTCDTVMVDHCLSSPCVRGNCTNSVHGFSCSCDYGYTGTTCDTEKCITFQGGCYYFGVQVNLTFSEAQKYCQQTHGAYLVTIETAAENQFLKSNIGKMKQESKGYWIGLSDQAVEGWFRWVHTGANLTFTDWDQQEPEPNNALGNENCVDMRQEYLYGWNDEECDWGISHICEKR